MQADILEAIRCQNEIVEALGHSFVVREMASAANLGFKDEADARERAGDIFYLMVVNCVFYAEGEEKAGMPAFTVEDLEKIKAGSKTRLAPLLAAVTRVNGLDTDANAKKSMAVQG